jgi:hypothetical protein
VAPPAGSNPTVWPPPPEGLIPTVRPLPQDRLLGLERDRDMGRDRDWDRDRDRTFRCGPSRGIGLSAVAPPAGLDFPLWPLPGDWTFRCGPSQGIRLSNVAPPTGSNLTVWPSSWDWLPHCGIVGIFFESMLLPLKGQPTNNVCMVEQYYPRPTTFMLEICSSLKKKAGPPGGANPWDQQQIWISRRIRIYIRNGFRMGIHGLGDVFLF